MTQRNEEWAKTIGHDDDTDCPNCPHRVILTVEVIDETVRMLPEVLEGMAGSPTVHHSQSVLVTYRDFVMHAYVNGFRPVDLKTREPIEGWTPPQTWIDAHAAALAAIVAAEASDA